jgi:hypothetical protein
MEAKEAISRLKSDLGAVRAQGRATVQIEALEQYLARLEQEAGSSLEYQKLELQRSLAQADATHQSGIEMFRSVIERLRQECLNASWFLPWADAQAKIGAWRTYFNESRPRSALEWATPAEFARRCCLQAARAMSEEPEISTSERY